MTQVNIQAAKTQLSRLVEEARAGKEIILAKAGKPMVRLVPVTTEGGERRSGQWAGRARLREDFDEEDPDVLRMFFGGKKPKSRR